MLINYCLNNILTNINHYLLLRYKHSKKIIFVTVQSQLIMVERLTQSGPRKNDIWTLCQSDGNDMDYTHPFFLVHLLYHWKKRYYLS